MPSWNFDRNPEIYPTDPIVKPTLILELRKRDDGEDGWIKYIQEYIQEQELKKVEKVIKSGIIPDHVETIKTPEEYYNYIIMLINDLICEKRCRKSIPGCKTRCDRVAAASNLNNLLRRILDKVIKMCKPGQHRITRNINRHNINIFNISTALIEALKFIDINVDLYDSTDTICNKIAENINNLYFSYSESKNMNIVNISALYIFLFKIKDIVNFKDFNRFSGGKRTKRQYQTRKRKYISQENQNFKSKHFS